MRIFLRVILIIFFHALGVKESFTQTIPVDSLYLGQAVPGNIPKVFNLPISGAMRPVERIAISSNGKEIYYGEINTYPASVLRVKVFQYKDNRWQGPFSVFEGFMAPKLSDDDSLIYLQDNAFHTFYSRRTDTGWSFPKRVIHKELRTHYYQKSKLNNVYVSSHYDGAANPDICKVLMTENDTVLQSLGFPLNNQQNENDFLIAADESYLIFSRNIPNGASDMHISFKRKDGGWTNPKKFGEPICKPGYIWEYGQFISNDGKYLFYTSGGLSWSSYYVNWVRIDNIIDSLKKSNFIPYLKFQIKNVSDTVGSSFSFTLPDSTFIDDDGNNGLIYSAILSNGNALPSWLSFNPIDRTFNAISCEAGSVDVRVTAVDSNNASATCNFNITIKTPTNVKNNRSDLPQDFELFQNYPNPANPGTEIKFSITKNGRYRLNLYNNLGELVSKISDREYSAGIHKESINFNQLASGVYFYQLIGSNAVRERKMIVLR